MKKFTIITLVALLLLALAACQEQQAEPTDAPVAEAGVQEEPTIVPTTAEPTVEPPAEESMEEPAAEPTEVPPIAEPAVAEETAAEETLQEPAVAEMAVPELYVPRDVQREYDSGRRSPDGNPGANYWQNHSVHDMSITVNPPDRTIQGTQDIVYTNNSPYPLSIVGFRMYQNVRKPGVPVEIYAGEDYYTDGIKVNEFAVDGEVVDWAPLDLPVETVKLIQLPAPLAPGDSVEFSFDWQYDLGLEPIREGVIEPTTFYLAYFFPRLAVVGEPDSNFGWDIQEYTYRPGRELNNEFADFTFEVNVPANYAVWATGDLLNPEEVLQPEALARLQESFTSDDVIQIATPEELQSGQVTAQSDTVTWRWQADNVLDVAIGISDSYFWDAGSVVVDPESGRRASVQAAYNPEATDFQNMVEYAKDALHFASTEWPGVPYPYPKMTGFRGGADEEFPMMFNDGSNVEDPRFSAFTAGHEILHTYFPFYMGTNEQRYPMMDEGWTTAFEYPFAVHALGQEWADDTFSQFRSGRLVEPASGVEIPIITPADSMRGYVTGYNAYEKSALGYLGLWDLMGEEAFREALHEFIDRWHGKHPLPWDMFNTFNDVSESDLTWYLQRWFFEPNYIDLRLESIEETDGGYVVQIANIGGMPIPFDVTASFADGSMESQHLTPAVWKDSPDATTVMIETDQEIDYVILDNGIFVDASKDNNGWPEGILDQLNLQAFIESVVLSPQQAEEVAPGQTFAAPEGWAVGGGPGSFFFYPPDGSSFQLAYIATPGATAGDYLTESGVDLDADFLETRTANGLEWSIYEGALPGYASRYAVTESDGTLYVILLATPPTPDSAIELSQEAILYPALDIFMVAGS